MAYFQQHNIKSITLQDNNLIITYNNKQKKEIKEINDQELAKIKSFAEKLGKKELSLSDLEKSFINQSEDKYKKGFYICLAIFGVLLVVGLIAWLVVRNKKEK